MDRQPHPSPLAPATRRSRHAALRQSQRNLDARAVDYVLAHATTLHRTGAEFRVLLARDVPAEDRRRDWVARLVGTVLVVADGTVVTCYRNRRALRAVARKPKHRRAPRHAAGEAGFLWDA